MKRSILGLSLFFITVPLFSQNPVLSGQKKDTIILYLKCNGSIASKENATYKRICYFDFEKEKLTFSGNIIDYYFPNGPIAFKANYKNGMYDGLVTNYYKTGAIKETGIYKNKKRDSIWTFYYKNSGIEKKIDYRSAHQKLIEYYKKNGKPIFLNGNGIYKGYSNESYHSCEQHKIKGEVKDGIMVGPWTIDFGYSVSTEVFENGKFIRGHEVPFNRIYEDASLINPSGFPYFENVKFVQYLIAYNKVGLHLPTYNEKDFKKGFLEELEQKIRLEINTNNFFYALIKFQLDDGVLKTNSFKSNTNNRQKATKLEKLILSLDKWDKPNKNVSFTIYLVIYWENGRIVLKPFNSINIHYSAFN